MMITSFKGTFLSNMHLVDIEYEGLVYPSAENAYQASKCEDINRREIFTRCNPFEAKKMGRQVKMRKDWDDVKLSIMETLLRLKFSHKDLGQKLLETGSHELLEGNDWGDDFWGIQFVDFSKDSDDRVDRLMDISKGKIQKPSKAAQYFLDSNKDYKDPYYSIIMGNEGLKYGCGLNHLGKILMKIRKELQNDPGISPQISREPSRSTAL